MEKETIKEVQVLIKSFVKTLEKNQSIFEKFTNDNSWKQSQKGGLTFKFLNVEPSDLLWETKTSVGNMHHKIVQMRFPYLDLMRVELGGLSPESYKILEEKFKIPQTLSEAELVAFINHYLYLSEETLKDLIVPLETAASRDTWVESEGRYAFDFCHLDSRVFFDQVVKLNASVIASLRELDYGLGSFLSKPAVSFNN